MAFKRKIDVDADDALPLKALKQPKLIPFPNMDCDDDVPMSDAEPFYPELYHSRSPSNVSSTSSNTSEFSLGNPPIYPAFDIYPTSLSNLNDTHYPAQSPVTPPIGLLRPSSSFTHHGNGCSQVPKLRVACAAGLNGQRTMWSFCEQCGSISMVEAD